MGAVGRIKASDLAPGMVLAGDLYSRQGRMLLPQGAVIEDKHLRILKIWGVTEAEVAGLAADASPPAPFLDISPEAFQLADEYLTPWFCQAGLDAEPVQEIYTHCLIRTAKQFALNPQFARSAPHVPRRDAAGASRPHITVKPSLERLLQRPSTLASLPAVYAKACEVLHSPRSSAADLARVVSTDTALTARLLQLVNSPLFGFPAPVESVSRAVALMGANELQTLILGISALEAFRGVDPTLCDMPSFWRHATACAVLARILAGFKAGLSVERFFVAGLLHDVGLLYLLLQEPETCGSLLRYAREQRYALDAVERSFLGFDHAEAGGALLRRWRFPEPLAHAVHRHHAPVASPPALDPSLLHVADCLARAYNLCEGDPCLMPALELRAWRTLELSPSGIGTALNLAEPQITALRRAFLVPDPMARQPT